MRVVLKASSEANETMGGANNLNGQGSKKAMCGCRRDMHEVKESFKVCWDCTGMC